MLRLEPVERLRVEEEPKLLPVEDVPLLAGRFLLVVLKEFPFTALRDLLLEVPVDLFAPDLEVVVDL